MKETIEELRLRFEAESDLKIKETLNDWKSYANWLEKISIQEINNETIVENKKLRKACWQTIDLLETVLTSSLKN